MSRSEKAFTLIELLVVIALIGLLSSIVLVSMSGTQERAKVARTISDLEQIGKAINFYWIDTEIDLPYDHSWGDNCEKAAMGSGNFSPKPAGWKGPYIVWPKTPWNTDYHWEHSGLIHSISIRDIPQTAAQSIDSQIDDGNLGTGKIFGSGARLEYSKDFSDLPVSDIHFISCTP